ncbi:MAG: ABC transporter permease subunit [Bellilinea sp.]
MKTILNDTLRRSRYLILGWGFGFGLLALYIILFYDSLAEQQVLLDQLIQAFPRELIAFFGNIDFFTTPEGYLTMELFSYLPIILGILAVGQGAAVISAAEENGTLDILLAHPLPRRSFFLGRFAGMALTLAGIVLLIWLGCVIALNWSSIPLSAIEMGRPFLSLWAFLTAFAAFATFLSQLLPSQAGASLTAAFILVVSYILNSMANIDDRLADVVKFSPYTYFQGGDALHGLNLTWLLGLIGATILFGGLALWRFQQRDLRIGGEGGWETLISLLSLRKTKKHFLTISRN